MAVVKRALTPEHVTAAALELIDRDGLEALSMRRLGEALGVEAMSLYHHIPSKTALLDAVVERALGELEFAPPVDTPWQQQFRQAARGFRALLLRHPHLIPLIARQQLASPGALRAAGGAMALLRAAGFDPETALQVFCFVDSYVLGFAFWEVGSRPRRTGEEPILAAPPGADPYLALLVPRLESMDCDASFEFGLDLTERSLDALLALRAS